MKNQTAARFQSYKDHVAQLNGVARAEGTLSFAVDPTVEQSLEGKVQESSDFLQAINIVSVDQQKGEKLGLGVTGPIASRTDTSNADRAPRDVQSMDKHGYDCAQTNFDTFYKYAMLDMWAKFPNFQVLLQNQIVNRIALDRIMIGWNGNARAADTDLVANPLLQDVNVGWMQKMRLEAPARVLNGVKVGKQAGADYNNMDAAVMDAGEGLDTWHRNSTDIVCICGNNLVADKYLALTNDHDAPTERAAMQMIQSNKQLGNRRTLVVPFFPDNAFMLTKLSNLSIYWQEGTRRRTIKDKPERNRIDDFNSVNEDYIVEDLGACTVFEGIRMPDGNGGWS